jgi:3-isopropylmalate/(R)-2-methylmalate dehydratase small subunit
VISARFADIFRGNAGKGGLLAAQCDQSDIELLWKLLENEPGTEVTVDLNDKTVRAKDFVCPFEIDDYTRWRLLEGLDDIALTLRNANDISEFEGRRPSWKPAVRVSTSG